MQPFAERLQIHASAPKDIVSVNNQLLRGGISSAEAETHLEKRRSSWDGVRGPFRGFLVAVRSDFVVNAETLVQAKPLRTERLEHKRAIGRLGSLQVVTVDIAVPLPFRNGRGYRYRGDIVAAELSPATTEEPNVTPLNVTSLIEEECLAVVSLDTDPYSFWDVKFDRVPTVA